MRVELEDRAAVPQSEVMLRTQRTLAANAHRARAVNADPLVRLDAHAVAQSGDRRRVLVGADCILAARPTDHRRSGRTMAAGGICRTCRLPSGTRQARENPLAVCGLCRLQNGVKSSRRLRPDFYRNSRLVRCISISLQARSRTAFEWCLKFSKGNRQ